MADIAFLLLIFFMASTTFRAEQVRQIAWPTAEATQKIDEKRKNVLHVWVEQDGGIWINDQRLPTEQVSTVVAPLYVETERRLVVAIRGDQEVPYRIMDSLQKELQEAGAVRVTFATRLEKRRTREER
ncbi:MAG: biopolymer transporter ExbD [Gemmatimonadetes bacterium]|nr:biopolymer transporter ExbD [Gemmatimonadota bacterium]